MTTVLHGLALAAAGILAAFTLRRAVLLVAAVWPERPSPAPAHTPSVCILVPCRDEAASLPGLLQSLDHLNYPPDRLQIVLVDDGSTDGTAEIAEVWARGRARARVISLPKSVGKAQALNAGLTPLTPLPGLTAGVGGEALVVYDADHRPAPGSLRPLAAAFADPRVAAASGQMRIANGAASPAAYYAMLESHVHQFVTMRAKDRLGLAPALLGANCAYRRSALDSAGGFRRGALLEDSDLTLAFAAAGWRTRFVAASVSEHRAPETVRGYVRQHLRWNRGFHQAAGGRLGALWAEPRLSLLLKVELTFFALGYADRLALVAAALCTAVDAARPGTFGFPAWIWAAYFGLPALEMGAALLLAREPAPMFLRLIYAPFFFALDVALALWSSALSAARRPLRWAPTERKPAKA